MATSKDYAEFIAAKFASLDVVSIKPMMGEYVIHMAGKVLGFIGDNQLMLEDGPTMQKLLPEAERRELFPGSKLFPIIDDGMSPRRLCEIAQAIYDDLPISKPRKKKADAAGGTKASAGKPAGKGTKGAKTAERAAAKAAEEARAREIEARFPFAKHFKD